MTGYFEISAARPEGQKAGEIAEVSIRVGEEILTRIADLESQTTRDFFRASAVTLALWFADNWWRLRSEPIDDPTLPSADWRLRHELAAASGGTLWPPIMIYSGGERVTFAPSIGRRHTSGSLRYLDTRVRTITAQQFELGVDEFFNVVLDGFASEPDAKILKALIQQLVIERGEAGLASWRRLEACLGYDADEAPEDVVRALLAMSSKLAPNDLQEAAIASQGNTAASDLSLAIEATEASENLLNFGLAERVDLEKVDVSYPSPWQLAEEAARQVRDIVALDRGPISDKALGDLLLANWERLKANTNTGRVIPYAARLRGSNSTEKVALGSVTDVDRRFEVARLFGDAIWTKQSPFGLISDAKTDRQKFQRAFAQSLLCPLRDIRQTVSFENPKRKQIVEASSKYGVHPHVIRNLLVYKGILPRETLDDQLEAA